MKPNDEQVIAIRQYLDKHLKYKETEDELFDHIVTALEHAPVELSLGEAMNHIIKDIGGLKGIAKIEKTAKITAIRTMLTKYVDTLQQVCFSPFSIIIAVCTLVAYYLINRVLFGYFGLMLVMMMMTSFPSQIITKHVIRSSSLVNVKNDAFKTMFFAFSMLTPAIILLSDLIIRFCSLNFYQAIMPYICTMAVCISIVQALVFYKLTREEFQIKSSEL